MYLNKNISSIRRLWGMTRAYTVAASYRTKITKNVTNSVYQISMVTGKFDQFSPYTGNILHHKKLSNEANENVLVDSVTFEKVCEETLQSLTECFEDLVESSQITSADVCYSSGVLTINFGPAHGTYVINRQSPNRQIWLSSPISGPKRYDFVTIGGYWVYKHDGKSLHQLLQEEMPNIVNRTVDFSKCSHSFIP